MKKAIIEKLNNECRLTKNLQVYSLNSMPQNNGIWNLVLLENLFYFVNCVGGIMSLSYRIHHDLVLHLRTKLGKKYF